MPSMNQKAATYKHIQDIHLNAYEKLREVEYVFADGLNLREAWAMFHNAQAAIRAIDRNLRDIARQVENNT